MNGEEVAVEGQRIGGEAGGEGTVADGGSFGMDGGGGRRLSRTGEGSQWGKLARRASGGAVFGMWRGIGMWRWRWMGWCGSMGSRAWYLVPSTELRANQVKSGRRGARFPPWFVVASKPCI